MPKAIKEIADELNDALRRVGGPCMTLTWPKFYAVCERERLKQAFLDELANGVAAEFQLVIAYGRNAVVICHDRNFAERGVDPAGI